MSGCAKLSYWLYRGYLSTPFSTGKVEISASFGGNSSEMGRPPR